MLYNGIYYLLGCKRTSIELTLPETLEGNNYKFNGTISDVRVTTKTDVEDDGSNNQVG